MKPKTKHRLCRLLTLLLGLSLSLPAAGQPQAPTLERRLVKRDLARLYLEQNQPRQALAVLQEALALGDSAELRLTLALTRLALQQPALARAELARCRELLAAHPDSRLLAELAYSEKVAGLLPEAAADYRRLLSLQPADARLWQQLGDVLGGSEARSSYLQALGLYRAAGTLPPPTLAFALQASGAPDEAESLFVELLAQDPSRAAYRIALATLRLNSEPDSARRLLEPVTLAGLTREQLLQLGTDWLTLQQPARAAAALAPVVAADPLAADTALLLEYADALRLSDQPAADVYLQAYRRLSNDRLDATGLRGLAYGLQRSQRPAEALEVLARLPQPTPADARQRAEALQALGRREEAIQAWMAAAADARQREDALYQLTRLQAWGPALKLLAQLPDSPERRLQRLRLLAGLDDTVALATALEQLRADRIPLTGTQQLELLSLLPQPRWLPALQKLLTPPAAEPAGQLAQALLQQRLSPVGCAPEAGPACMPALAAFARRRDLSAEQRQLLAELLINLAAWDAATTLLNEQQQAQPQLLRWRILAARLNGLRGQRDAAVAALRQLAADPQLSPADRQGLGDSAYRLGDWEGALASARQLLKQAPGNDAARLLLANSLRELGRLELAEPEYRRLLDLPTDNPQQVHYGLALVQQARDRRLEAAEQFRLAARDPRLEPQAETYRQLLFRQRMALNPRLDYSPFLGLATNDFYLRGAYTPYWLAETRQRLQLHLPAENTAADGALGLELSDGLYLGDSATWLDFNRLQGSLSLRLPWRWQQLEGDVAPVLGGRLSSVIQPDSADFGRQIGSLNLGLQASVKLLPQLQLSAAGQLSLGEPDLLLGSFEQGSARLQLDYFPPDMRLGLSAGYRHFLLYDGVGSLQQVQGLPVELIFSWERPELIYQGLAEFSPMRGDFADLNLNLNQSLRWFLTPNLNLVAALELHKYFNPLQRNQSLANLQAGLAWRLPLPQTLPLWLEVRGRLNAFFDTDEALRPGGLVMLRSEL